MIIVFRLIEKSLSSIYKTVHQAHVQNFGSSSGASVDAMDTETSSVHGSFIELPKEFFQMLVSAGPYLYRNTLLLQKVYIFIFYVVSCTLSSIILHFKHEDGFNLITLFLNVGVSSVERILLVCTGACR